MLFMEPIKCYESYLIKRAAYEMLAGEKGGGGLTMKLKSNTIMLA